MNRDQKINEIIKVLAESPVVDGIDGFEEVKLHFESEDDLVATPELVDEYRNQLFAKIANMVLTNRKSDVLSGMDGRWDAARLEKGFTFGGKGIEMLPLCPEKNYKYKFLCWVR